MNAPPSISVVIPVHNGADDLPGALDSVLAQTIGPVEIVVLNDGSGDCTAEVMSAYGTRIRAVHQTAQGAAALARTRNTAVRAATGEWIAFLDHDDLWEPEELSRQIARACETGADIVYTNARNFGESERVAELRSDPNAMPEGDLFAPLLHDNFLVMSSVLMRRSLFDRIGGFTESPVVSEDWDLWLKAAAHGARFAAIGEPLTRYRWRAGSFSRNHTRVRDLRLLTVRRALQTERGRQLPWPERQRILAGVERCSAWFLASVNPRQAVSWYVRSLIHWPFDVSGWKGLVKGCLGRS